MHPLRLWRPLRLAVSMPSSLSGLAQKFAQLRLGVAAGRRHASTKSQGAYKLKNKKTIAKKMGAKKTGDQYVIPGNILYKQRGTIWHPGENTIMGRDHTIHAAVTGYVKYYRDPLRHPKRQYIGVVFERDDKLPYPAGTPRKRRLGMIAVTRKKEIDESTVITASGIPRFVVRHDPITPPEPTPEPEIYQLQIPPDLDGPNRVVASLVQERITARAKHLARIKALKEQREAEMAVRRATRTLRLRKDYSYAETNWEIGRLVGDAGHVAGTEKVGSRRKAFKTKRAHRMALLRESKERAIEKAARREQQRRNTRRNRERRTKEAAEAARASA